MASLVRRLLPRIVQNARAFSTQCVGANLESNGKRRVLMTGALGQIGTEMVITMRERYGVGNVIASDVRQMPADFSKGPFLYLDTTKIDMLHKAVVEHKIDTIVHMAGILSGTGEKFPQLAMNVNSRGIENVLEVARIHGLKVFAPSTIAAFGPTSPKVDTPDLCIMRPISMYGVTKIYLELLGEYYQAKYGVDFRSVRYPGIISCLAMPGGGTTDYAVEIYHEAVKCGKYKCFLKADTPLPMMYMPDCINGTIQLIEAPAEKLKQRVFNMTAMSFTPNDLYLSIKKVMPEFQISYDPDFRQKIAESWPSSLNQDDAIAQWGWKPEYDVDRMTADMLAYLKKKYAA